MVLIKRVLRKTSGGGLLSVPWYSVNGRDWYACEEWAIHGGAPKPEPLNLTKDEQYELLRLF